MNAALCRLRSRAALADQQLFDDVSRIDSPLLDATMPRLTRAADFSRLWLGIALGLALTGRRGRKAATRGLINIAFTSAIANQVAKRIFRRRRPDNALVPLLRRSHRVPMSRSFPSGHTASAVAFAVGAGREMPVAALPLGAAAAAVGFSRVYTGRHFPGDVVAGAALGAGIAVAAKALVPGTEPLVVPQPARPVKLAGIADGEGIVAVVNPSAGPVTRQDFGAWLRSEFPAADVRELGEDDDIPSVLEEAARTAKVLAVSGGDGTVNCAARSAMAAGIPLLVLPGGTFNHFAADLGSIEPDDIADAIRSGRGAEVDVAKVNDETFLNTSSIGNYPAFVRYRERWEGRVGKPIAAFIATYLVLRHEDPIDIVVDGVRHRVVMLFVGNCAYSPGYMVPRGRNNLADGKLDIRVIEAGRKLELIRLVRSAILGRLSESHLYSKWTATEVDVRLPGARAEVAVDGEVVDDAKRFGFSKVEEPLTVYWPGRPDDSGPR